MAARRRYRCVRDRRIGIAERPAYRDARGGYFMSKPNDEAPKTVDKLAVLNAGEAHV
jgi:hypothetical protein